MDVKTEVYTCPRCGKAIHIPTGDCPYCGFHLDLTPQDVLRILQSNPAVRYVRVVVSDDACAACRFVEGTYPKEEAPELPVPDCSHPLGCRCTYEPLLEDIFP